MKTGMICGLILMFGHKSVCMLKGHVFIKELTIQWRRVFVVQQVILLCYICLTFPHFIAVTVHVTTEAPETKLVEFANSVDTDKAADNEPPHLYLHR